MVGLRAVLDRLLDGLGRTSPNALPSTDHMLAFMDECLAIPDGLATVSLVRADNGFFDGKLLDYP